MNFDAVAPLAIDTLVPFKGSKAPAATGVVYPWSAISASVVSAELPKGHPKGTPISFEIHFFHEVDEGKSFLCINDRNDVWELQIESTDVGFHYELKGTVWVDRDDLEGRQVGFLANEDNDKEDGKHCCVCCCTFGIMPF